MPRLLGGIKSNYFVNESIDYSTIQDTFISLADLGIDYQYTHFIFINGINRNVIFKFSISDESREMLIPSKSSGVLDDFYHHGVIEVKYDGTAPTEGTVSIICY